MFEQIFYTICLGTLNINLSQKRLYKYFIQNQEVPHTIIHLNTIINFAIFLLYFLITLFKQLLLALLSPSSTSSYNRHPLHDHIHVHEECRAQST